MSQDTWGGRWKRAEELVRDTSSLPAAMPSACSCGPLPCQTNISHTFLIFADSLFSYLKILKTFSLIPSLGFKSGSSHFWQVGAAHQCFYQQVHYHTQGFTYTSATSKCLINITGLNSCYCRASGISSSSKKKKKNCERMWRRFKSWSGCRASFCHALWERWQCDSFWTELIKADKYFI